MSGVKQKIALFGASGMVGQGVLRECLAAPQVEKVTSVTRRPTGVTHEKLTEIVHPDFTNFQPIASQLQGHDACFWCLGVSYGDVKPDVYKQITYESTLNAAKVMLHPGLTWIYVSGDGTDVNSSMEWARVKGKTEADLLALPFKQAAMFRPGVIQPMHGIKSSTRSYRYLYNILGPVLPVLKAIAPSSMTSTQNIGWAMLQVAEAGVTKPICFNKDMNTLAAAYAAAHNLKPGC